MKKRIVSLILAACLAFNMSSMAYATEPTQSEVVNVSESEEILEKSESEGDTESEEHAESEVIQSEEPAVTESTEISESELEAEVADMMANGKPFDGTITGVDENGNVYVIEDAESGVVQEMMTRQRAVSTQVVNFRANASGQTVSGVTSYIEYETGNAGYVYGPYGADAAYLGMEGGKVKFLMSGVIGLVDPSKVQIVNLSSAKSYSNYYANGTNLIHNICMNMASSSGTYGINVGPQPSYLTKGTTYYSYDGHYFYRNYDTMLADYKAGHRNNSVNPNSPYYNYYQYLPLRGKSNYSASELQNMINAKVSTSSKMYNTGAAFVDKQNTYGVNALLMAAAGAHESAWGTSSIALAKNNLFGLNAVDSSPGESANTFSSVAQCIKDFAETYMSKRYLRQGWSYYHGGFLGDKASGINVSYASDPYWGEKIASIAWELDNKNGKKDQYVYTIGIKDTINTEHTQLNVRKEATTASSVVYNTGDPSNYAFLILGESGNFYKVMSDPVLNSSRTAINASSGVHTGASMYVYVSKDYVKKVIEGSGKVTSTLPENYLIKYNTHIQSYGWGAEVADGSKSGTEGEAKRLEGIRISLGKTGYSGSVEYRTHVQTYGWQNWVKDGNMSGTEGEAKRLEGIQIRLTGDVAKYYDIYYRVHAQSHGWLDWAKNGEMAGTEGGAKRLESIEIRLVKKGSAAPGATETPFVSYLVKYRSHVQTYGWQDYVLESALSGTEGEAKRLEAIRINATLDQYKNDIEYQVHVQTYGWQDWRSAGQIAGTTGEAKRLEAMRIRLKGELEEKYDIYYRVHCETYGWLDWAKNGEMAGTSGLAKRMESYQIVLVEKGGAAPGKTTTPCVEK